MERHFANWGGGREIDVQRLERSPTGLAAYRAEPWRLTFFSSVNCCLSQGGMAARAVPRRAVRGGPADRARADRGRVRQGLQSRGSRPAFARVPADSLLPPLLRRVSRAPRGARSPRAGRGPAHGSILAVADGGGPEVAAGTRRSWAAPDVEAPPVPTAPCAPTARSDPRLSGRSLAAVAAPDVLAGGPLDLRPGGRSAQSPARKTGQCRNRRRLGLGVRPARARRAREC